MPRTNRARKRRKLKEARRRDPSLLASRRDESDDVQASSIVHNVDTLSEYEKERLRNVQKNKAFLVELNLNQAKQDFNATVQGTKAQHVRGLSKAKKRIPAVELRGPRRQSLRLQSLSPTGEPRPELRTSASSVDEPKLTCYFPRHVKAGGLKQMKQYSTPCVLDECPRKPSGPLYMEPTNSIEQGDSDVFVYDLKELSDEVRNNTVKITGERKETEASRCEQWVVSFEEQIMSRTTIHAYVLTKSYERSLKRLRVTQDHIAKVVPQRIFSVAFHPSKRKSIVFAGDKWGRLGIWDVGSSQGEDGVYLFEPHSRPINCMVMNPVDPAKLYTSSYDGTMRCCDVNTATFQEVYTCDDYERLIHFAFGSSSTQTVLAGDDSGAVVILDTRIKKRLSIAEQKYQLHQRSIKCVDVHPLNPNIFLTSSLDSTFALWDLRNIKNKCHKLSSVQRSNSVTSAYFSPLTGRQIVSTSLDDHIIVYEVNSSGQVSTTPKCLFRHSNHVGRWLSSFRATWDPKSDSYFVVGSLNRERQIDIYSSEKQRNAVMHLRHENLNSINSVNVFHPTLNLLAGANSSGKVYLWSE